MTSHYLPGDTVKPSHRLTFDKISLTVSDRGLIDRKVSTGSQEAFTVRFDKGTFLLWLDEIEPV